MSLLSVGTIAFDSLYTPHGDRERVVGGSCLYSTYSASFFIDQINAVSIIGEDFPKEDLKEMQYRGISLEGVKTVEGGKSFFWAGRYHPNMIDRDTITTELNVLADFDPILPDSYKDAKYVLLANLSPQVQNKVLDQLDSEPTFVVLDTMNFWIDSALEELKRVIGRCHLLTINDEEARMLSGEHSLVQAAAAILEMGPKYLIIKKGEHGSLLFGSEDVFFAPALPLPKVIDPTGAGDCFAGGLLGHIAQSGDTSFENLKRGVIYGSTMASFIVEDFSIERLRDLDEKEISARLQRFVNLTRWSI